MKQAIRGVNLGGWFIPEKWMNQSLFASTDAVDLYTLLATPQGVRRYTGHLDTWIKEEDFEWMSTHGIRLVRLPIGYWSLSADEPYPSTRERLDWAFRMAEKYAVKVLLDLHGLKGSQNGHDHSGRRGRIVWQGYENEMLLVLETLAMRYSSSSALWGIEVINEPKIRGNYFRLLRYYRRAYSLLKKHLKPGQYTVYQDGFAPLLFMNSVWWSSKYPVAMDTHFYALPKQFALSESRYFTLLRIVHGWRLALAQVFQPVIIGEWSGVLPQPMFDRLAQSEHQALLARSIHMQQAIYRPALAMMYWNYKAELPGMWNYRSLVENGTIAGDFHNNK